MICPGRRPCGHRCPVEPNDQRLLMRMASHHQSSFLPEGGVTFAGAAAIALVFAEICVLAGTVLNLRGLTIGFEGEPATCSAMPAPMACRIARNRPTLVVDGSAS